MATFNNPSFQRRFLPQAWSLKPRTECFWEMASSSPVNYKYLTLFLVAIAIYLLWMDVSISFDQTLHATKAQHVSTLAFPKKYKHLFSPYDTLQEWAQGLVRRNPYFKVVAIDEICYGKVQNKKKCINYGFCFTHTYIHKNPSFSFFFLATTENCL